MDTYTTPTDSATETAKIGEDQPCTITTEISAHSQAAFAASPDQVLAEHADEVRRLSKRLIDDLLEIGRQLIDAKARVGRGHWLSWLEREFGWRDDTARRYMRLYQFAQEDFEFRKLRNLQLPASGLYLLAQAKCPLEARKEIVERAEAGETIDVAKIESIITAHERPASKGWSPERWRRHRAQKRGKAITEREELASTATEGIKVASDIVPHVTKRNDIGPASTGDVGRKLARLDEPEAEVARLKRQNTALESEVAELNAKVARLERENRTLREELTKAETVVMPATVEKIAAVEMPAAAEMPENPACLRREPHSEPASVEGS